MQYCGNYKNSLEQNSKEIQFAAESSFQILLLVTDYFGTNL